LYFFDNKVVKYAKNLKPSKRGEIEIVDLLNKYKKQIIYTLTLLAVVVLGLIQDLLKIFIKLAHLSPQ